MDKALLIQNRVVEILGTDEVYLVGGSVRDVVMGNNPKDYDFCTPMLPDNMEAAVKKAGLHVYGIGKKFGTIGFKVPIVEANYNTTLFSKTIPVAKYEYVEVTTFRSEVYTSKSRKPEVEFVSSLNEDLARRDFTMNAMVLRPNGKIYDPYGGRLDIYAKLIKTVGLPKERIMEDPLRMLRAARFAARYGFSIDASFIGKARQLADRIYDVSVERWVQELDKLLTSSYVDTGIQALVRMDIWRRILPELPDENILDSPIVPTFPDQAWREVLSYLDENPKIARYIATGICQRLKFSNVRTNAIIKGDIYTKEK